MAQSHVVTGTLIDGQTLKLDGAIPIRPGKVRVVVEVIDQEPKRPFAEVMEEIWDNLRKSGHKPPSREEVDAYLRAERESWDD